MGTKGAITASPENLKMSLYVPKIVVPSQSACQDCRELRKVSIFSISVKPVRNPLLFVVHSNPVLIKQNTVCIKILLSPPGQGDISLLVRIVKGISNIRSSDMPLETHEIQQSVLKVQCC